MMISTYLCGVSQIKFQGIQCDEERQTQLQLQNVEKRSITCLACWKMKP